MADHEMWDSTLVRRKIVMTCFAVLELPRQDDVKLVDRR